MRRVINPNAYDIAIPTDWGIPSTFNICDLVLYKGSLEVPSEPDLPLDSSVSSLFAPEENDGPHSPSNSVTDNGSQTGRRQENSVGALKESNLAAEIAGHQQQPEKPTVAEEVAEVRAGRRQPPAKLTARPSEFYYF